MTHNTTTPPLQLSPLEHALAAFQEAQRRRLAAGAHNVDAARALIAAREALNVRVRELLARMPYTVAPCLPLHFQTGARGGAGALVHFQLAGELTRPHGFRRSPGETLCASSAPGPHLVDATAHPPCSACVLLMEKHAGDAAPAARFQRGDRVAWFELQAEVETNDGKSGFVRYDDGTRARWRWLHQGFRVELVAELAAAPA